MQARNRNYRRYSYTSGSRLAVPPAKKRRLRKPVVAFAIILVVFFAGKSLLGSAQDPEADKNALGASTQTEQKPKKTVDTSNLQASLEQISKQYPYNTGIAVIELNSGKLIQTGDSHAYIAASTTKLLTAQYYLKNAESGKYSLTQKIGSKTAEEQMRLMINQSDNTAWQQLNEYIGKDKLQEFAHQEGLKSYNAADNTMTTDDMARLLSNIYQQKSLNDKNTQKLYSWMQNTSEERFIPPAIPEGAKLYHKAGYLPDRVHDVAIVDNGSTPFVLVIYSKSYTPAYDYTRGQKLYKQIATQVFNTFNK